MVLCRRWLRSTEMIEHDQPYRLLPLLPMRVLLLLPLPLMGVSIIESWPPRPGHQLCFNHQVKP